MTEVREKGKIYLHFYLFEKEGKTVAEARFLYRQTYDAIRRRIEEGIYGPSSLLPTEGALCREFHVSAITVKKALALLTEEGLVRRVPGKGTIVLPVPAGSLAGERPAPAAASRIGLVLEHVSTPFGLEMLYRLDREAEEAGLKLDIRFSYSDQKKESQEIDFLLREGVRGLLIMPCRGEHYNTAILRLVVNGFPIVLLDKKLEGLCLPSVRTENREGAARLTRYLAEKGCRRIAMITSAERGTTSLQEREQGFFGALREANLEPFAVVRVSGGELLRNLPSAQAIETLSAWLAGEGKQADGIVCLEYGFVPALFAAMRACGRSLGGSLRVCCFDEDYLAPQGPLLTHVKQDEAAIAHEAMALLRRELETGMVTEEECRVPGRFVEAAE